MTSPRTLSTARAALVAIAASLTLASAPAFARVPPTAASGARAVSLDQAQLLADVRTLASPEFGGRKTATEGSAKAQAYLTARFAALGLRPFGSGYAQPFSFTNARAKPPADVAGVNLVGYIAGTAQPQRYIVVSAHYDHLGTKDGQMYPGADDNASGVATMLAMAAWFKDHPPLHTIVFAAFDAEEMGLRGASAFVKALPFPQSQLALNLNFDMVGHNDNEIFVTGTHYTPAFKPLIAQVAARSTIKVSLGHDDPGAPGAKDKGAAEDWTDSSDHGPFHKAGVPYLYAGVEDHPDYHKPSDTFAHLNAAFFVKAATMLIDLGATLDQQP
jgi:Zn-dependent M28 family amino/carboxypeptidase